MLTVVTGLPGAGKSLYVLSKVLPEYRGRRIFTYGIPGINHESLGTEPLDDPEKWFDLPEGAVVVIDEAQKVFPQRPPSRPVPRKCSEFETHRHRGFDVVLLTQDATTLDVHLRKLTGRHLHVHRLFGAKSANVYEYSTFEPKPTDKKTQKGALAVRTFRHDPKIYELYKSADLHTVKRKIPVRLIVVVSAMALGGVYLAWAVYFFAAGKLMDVDGAAQSVAAESSSGAGSSGPVAARQSQSGGVTYDPAEYAKMMKPLIPGLLHTAPFYQASFQPSEVPIPVCVIIGEAAESACRCYTQQVTTYETTEEICRYVAKNGFFDPRGQKQGSSGSAAQPRDVEPVPSRLIRSR